MGADKKRKIEGSVSGKRYMVREVFIDSGRVARILLSAEADSNESAKDQLRGALQFFQQGTL